MQHHHHQSPPPPAPSAAVPTGDAAAPQVPSTTATETTTTTTATPAAAAADRAAFYQPSAAAAAGLSVRQRTHGKEGSNGGGKEEGDDDDDDSLVVAEDSPYFLPVGDAETRRLWMQASSLVVHILLRTMFNGLFHTPQHDVLAGGNARVLDVGCGPGSWSLEMARAFPNAEFVGLDVTPYERPNAPSNASFLVQNVTNGIEYPDNTFDLCFQRYLVIGYKADQWKGVLDELIRVTKPGGYIQLVEMSSRYYCFDPANPARPTLLADGPMFRLMEAGEKLADLCRAATGLVDVTERVGSFPIGWGGPTGRLCAADYRTIFTRSRDLFARVAGLAVDEFDELVVDGFKHSAEAFVYNNVYCVTARVEK
ncbi:S-adenosyl-L-methionine-dependent methyltransferase [Zopfochytrium polystomum]|nr:S-adenosyl-L-methionine-dependent methyltransferase [Zopfochytrium polystomum]